MTNDRRFNPQTMPTIATIEGLRKAAALTLMLLAIFNRLAINIVVSAR